MADMSALKESEDICLIRISASHDESFQSGRHWGLSVSLDVRLRTDATWSSVHLLCKHSPGPESILGLHIHLESSVSSGPDGHQHTVYWGLDFFLEPVC